jgi:hypothetical protein
MPTPPDDRAEVPENDALEQAQEVVETPPNDPPHLGREVPEADALEQSQELHVVDEDYGA